MYRDYEQRIRRDEALRVRQEEAQRFELEALRLQLEALRVREEETQRLLVRFLTRRFGTLSDDALGRIQQADQATLERWMDRVLVAQSSEDIFA